MSVVAIHPEVESALATGRAVVALESAVMTHGMPREVMRQAPRAADDQWNATQPVNLECARCLERAVRSRNAVPATIGVIGGCVRVGLLDEELKSLANDPNTRKCSTRDLAAAITSGASGGTTVAATLDIASRAQPAPIRVMATGGIGGVHRGARERLDVSADLIELSRTPVCVVCAGPKSILEIEATAEALEMLGVPAVGYRTAMVPQFICRDSSTIPVSHRVDDPAAAVDFCRVHWDVLGHRSAVLICQPIAREAGGVEALKFTTALRNAEDQANQRIIRGAERTPFLLRLINDLLGGAALEANIALLIENALLAADIAASLARHPTPHEL